MKAYVIADVTVTDPEKFKEYGKKVPPTVDKYKGKYIVRGGAVDKAEGDWNPSRIVIIEFENLNQAKKWYQSEEYSGPLALRRESAFTNVLFVEGV